jgi:hypothetical protein
VFITEGNPAFSLRLMICGLQSNKDEHLREECRILRKRKIGCHASAKRDKITQVQTTTYYN